MIIQFHMKFSKNLLIYGASMGIILIILQAAHYKMMLSDISIEVFGFIIGAVFLAMGFWLAKQYFIKPSFSYQIDDLMGKNKGLSKRELEVLLLMGNGLTNQEIADTLFVSLNTIKTHISNIYLKLNVKRRTQAVQKAIELNIFISSEA